MTFPAVAGILSEIESIALRPIRGPLFRGRPGVRDLVPDSFAPPAPQRRNRFNAKGQRALYLASSRSVLHAELSQDQEISGYWVQEFLVPAEEFKILRLDPGALAGTVRLNQLAALTEYRRLPELPDPYAGTVFLRSLCDQRGIDGIEYPTVTGGYADDGSAVNIALISPTAIDAVISNVAEAAPIFVPGRGVV